MSLLLAIDPGVTCPGAALFDLGGKTLFAATHFRAPGFRGDANNIVDTAERVWAWAVDRANLVEGHVTQVAAEWMVPRRKGPKNAHDLGAVWAFTGAVLALASPAKSVVYKPDQWKGSKRANPTARWILGKLTAMEAGNIFDVSAFTERLNAAAQINGDPEVSHLAHNSVDAVGIGLHHLGRLTRQRVIAR